MADNRSPESSIPISPSVQALRQVGSSVERPEVSIPVSAREVTSISSSPGRSYEIGSQIKMLLDPSDPNYQLEMARLSGLMNPERHLYERDPLGLYSAAVNYAETMLKFARIPSRGTSDFDSVVENYVQNEEKRLKERNVKLVVTDDMRDKWKDEARLDLGVTEVNTRKELDRNFRLSVATGNRSIIETLAMLEAFVPPKPFEANMQERRLTDGRQALEAIAVYFEGQLPEKISGWYRTYDAVNEQQIGLFNILCSVGGGLEGYYDALVQAGGTLLSRATFHASAADFRAAYTRENPGVSTIELTDKEKDSIKDTLASKEIHEMSVEMLSQARRLVLFNVDAGQLNKDKPDGKEGLMNPNPDLINRKIARWRKKKEEFDAAKLNKESERVQEHINSLEATLRLNFGNHREFMQLVFGEIDKNKWVKWKSPDSGKEITTPKEISTWYGDNDSLGGREVWLSKMMAILLWKEKNKKISAFLESANPAEIEQVAKDIIKSADEIRRNIGDKLKNANPEFITAKIALLSWIEKDKGFQFSGSLAWKFNYNDEVKTTSGGKRKLDKIERFYDAGGIYKAYDSINLYAYWRRLVNYKRGLKSATQYFTPMKDEWARDVSRHSPDWLPPLERSFEINKKIKRIHDRFFDDTPEMILWRAQRLTGDSSLTQERMDDLIAQGRLKKPVLDSFVKSHLMENGWTYETAYDVPIPMYLPKNFRLTPWETMKDQDKDTPMGLLKAGVLLEDIDWDSYNYESLGRHWVSMSMLNKFAHLFVDSYESERDSDFQKFFKDPGVQSIAEMSKRVYLAFRDLPEGYQQYIPAIVPFMIAQNAYSSIISTTDLGAPGAKERIIKQWNYIMGEWIRAAMWVPQVILDDEQLYSGATADMQSMRNDIALMIMYYKHVFEKVAQAAFKSDTNILHNIFDDQMGLYISMDELQAEKDSGEAEWGVGAPKIPLNWLEGEKKIASDLFGERH